MPTTTTTTTTKAAKTCTPVPAGGLKLPSHGTLMRAIAAVDMAATPHAPAETAATKVRGFSRTPFHSAALPTMSLQFYANHLSAHAGYRTEGLAVGLALMARYAVASGRGVTPLAMHRLLGTCIQVGMKATSDVFVKNVHVAPVAGMTLAELNALEVELLRVLEFRAIPTFRELNDLPRALAALVVVAEGDAPKPAPTRPLVQSLFQHFAHTTAATAAPRTPQAFSVQNTHGIQTTTDADLDDSFTLPVAAVAFCGRSNGNNASRSHSGGGKNSSGDGITMSPDSPISVCGGRGTGGGVSPFAWPTMEPASSTPNVRAADEWPSYDRNGASSASALALSASRRPPAPTTVEC